MGMRVADSFESGPSLGHSEVVSVSAVLFFLLSGWEERRFDPEEEA